LKFLKKEIYETYYKNYERRCGNSTRQIDAYVQELFTKGNIVVWDHHNTPHATKFLFDNVVRRLSIEHPHLFSNKNIIIDANKFEITLI